MANKYSINMNWSGPTQVPAGTVNPGDHITWFNYVGQDVDLTYPTCVSPHGGSTIKVFAGSSVGPENVDNSSHGSYNYTYSWPADSTYTQNGTIDVS